jgi:aminopeptidase N
MQRLLIIFSIASILLFHSCSESEEVSQPMTIEAGVPLSLAQYRAEHYSNVRYELSFNIPEAKAEPINGFVTVSFDAADIQQPLALDFKVGHDPNLRISKEGQDVAFTFEKEHIIIPASYLVEGTNSFSIAFQAGDMSLNRNEDYLYTLLVPDRARTVFPCFDQPNIKARFSLNLEIPAHWKASANSSLEKTDEKGETTIHHFNPSDQISTYLFAFAAGDFKEATAQRDGRPMRMLYRESDTAKVNQSVDAIFDLHASALNWLEEYTHIPYPFEKFDFVLIPTFQYGGMEHVGNIFYREGSLMLDEGATINQQLGRASLIAHETAHMWFGDLVTMDWFNDVWLKEVFANFMAAKIVNPSFPEINHDLRFLLAHQPSAYGEDRSEGSHPIQQPLDNLQDAGTLYGRIIYQKAPVVMRQLETMIGEENFRQGLQSYLRKFSFSNATWDDLVNILDARTDMDLQQWSQVWVKEPDMPVLATTWTTKDGKISDFTIQQEKKSRGGAYWQQETTVTLFYADSIHQADVTIRGKNTKIPKLNGLPEPLAILPCSAPISYGYYQLDEQSREYLLANSPSFEDPVLRGATSLALYEAFLNGAFEEKLDYFNGLMVALNEEEEPLNRQRLLSQLSTVFWQFLSEEEQALSAPVLETLLWNKLQEATEPGAKRSYFNTYRSVATTEAAISNLKEVYEEKRVLVGLRFSESDRNSLATALALRLPEEADQILEREIAATQNPDRRKYLEFVKPALSPDQAVRDAFFESLKNAENREIEPYVGSAVSFLHHPLRAEASIKYIRPSLELVEEIQSTGDIFFPRRWIGATLGGHHSPEAARIVRDFLSEHPDYPYRLKNKILMGADLLFRSSEGRPDS